MVYRSSVGLVCLLTVLVQYGLLGAWCYFALLTDTGDYMNKLIEDARNAGSGWLPSHGETCFRTLDASDVAAWLTAQGYTVISNMDTGRNGLAKTACGLSVSTNGHVSAA